MSPRRARVLIVDDDADTTALLSRLLERRGHRVCVAHSVDEALRVAREFVPSVALLDIMIRCESGYFLARDLREIAGLSDCSYVAMTGFDREQNRHASEAAGFRRHLLKPINEERLFEAIESSGSPRE